MYIHECVQIYMHTCEQQHIHILLRGTLSIGNKANDSCQSCDEDFDHEKECIAAPCASVEPSSFDHHSEECRNNKPAPTLCSYEHVGASQIFVSFAQLTGVMLVYCCRILPAASRRTSAI